MPVRLPLRFCRSAALLTGGGDWGVDNHSALCLPFCQIRNGSTASSPLIDRLCGGILPNPVFTASNQLYLRFKSDFSNARDGFEATWTSSPQGSNTLRFSG